MAAKSRESLCDTAMAIQRCHTPPPRTLAMLANDSNLKSSNLTASSRRQYNIAKSFRRYAPPPPCSQDLGLHPPQQSRLDPLLLVGGQLGHQKQQCPIRQALNNMRPEKMRSIKCTKIYVPLDIPAEAVLAAAPEALDHLPDLERQTNRLCNSRITT